MPPFPRILFLDVKLPRPDRDAASLRSAQVLRYLADHGDVDLAVMSAYGFDDTAVAHAAGLGARLVGLGGADAIRGHLRDRGAGYAVVICAWSRTATAFLAEARHTAPDAGLVYDTLDVNHVREFRHARATGNARRLHTAMRVRDEEVAAIRLADRTIAITEVDRAVLAQLVPTARIEVAGFAVEPATSVRRPAAAATVLFVGHYQAAPNHDAALILAREVLPLLHAARPDLVLALAGSDPGPDIEALAGPCVVVPGWEADLAPRLDAAHVFAAPLRFGSGLKGKILQAMAHRVPLVASAVAVEGTGLEPGRGYLPAETPAACAEGILRIIADPALGASLADNAICVLRARFSAQTLSRQLDAVFAGLL